MPARKRSEPIGKRLLKLRRQRKLSLKHMANETGLSTQYITEIEKGEVIPPVAVLLQLSRALEIDSGSSRRGAKRCSHHRKFQCGNKAEANDANLGCQGE